MGIEMPLTCQLSIAWLRPGEYCESRRPRRSMFRGYPDSEILLEEPELDPFSLGHVPDTIPGVRCSDLKDNNNI